MIVESIVNFILLPLDFVFSMFSAFSLPLQSLTLVSSILSYASYVVGSDMIVLIFSSVGYWLQVKLTIGVAIWVYKMIPFT